ncbi:MAG: EamA family transporter [Clostridia bacterium]|nr:EamA family transporter [Clostridia bacterium]
MNVPLTLILSLAAALGGSIAKKYYTDKEPAGLSGGFAFNAVGCLTAAVILLCWGGFGTSSVFTIWLGVVFGAVTALQGITNIAALQVGPMSYTSVIISFSTLISALSGVMFFDESLGWAQIVGIVLMLASFVLAAKSDGDEKKANLKWLFLCLITFAATGGIGIMQKVHQSSEYRDELNAFLIIAFVSSAIICTVFAALLKRREGRSADSKSNKNVPNKHFVFLLTIMIASGACVAVNNKFNLYLSGVMDSAVFFPIVNGGGLVLTTLSAVLLFKERLSKKRWVGVVLGIASVVFLCNPFA